MQGFERLIEQSRLQHKTRRSGLDLRFEKELVQAFILYILLRQSSHSTLETEFPLNI